MPIYTIGTPDGRKLKIEAPDEATAMRGAQDWGRKNAKPKTSSVFDQIGAFAQSATEQIPFLDEAAAGVVSLTSGKPYRKVRQVQRELAAEDRRERPLARNAGGVAGFGATLAAPGAGYIKGAKTFSGATARSAQVGAAYGAVAGAGAAEGGLESRVRGGAQGAVLGGVVGGALPAAVKMAQGVPGAAQRVGAGATEAGSRVARQFGREAPQASVTPEVTARAEEYVGRLAASKGVTPETLRADPALAMGKPVTGAEALGRTGTGQLTALGRRSGQTPDALEAILAARGQEAGSRIVDDFAGVAGIDPATIADDFAAMTDVLRKAAKPAYDQAYAVGAMDSPELRSLAQRPSVKAALQRAARIAGEEGRAPQEIGLEVVGASSNGLPESIQIKAPTAQTWDYIKRGMDDVLEGYRDKTTRRLNLDTEGRAVVGTQSQLRNELVAQNPAYGEALSKGGEPLRLEQAWRDAPGLLNSRVSERVFVQRFDKLGEAEKQAFLGGFANDLFERARSGRLNPKDFRNPAFREKMARMLGPDKAKDFTARLEQELRLSKGSRMSPGTNSVTEEVRQASQELDRGVGFVADLQRRLDGGQNVLKAVPATAANALAAPVAGFVRGMQAPLNQAMRDEVGRLLMLSPDELANVLARQARPTTPRNALAASGAPAVSNYAAGRE